MFILIAAVNQVGTIGLEGSMPWHNPEDFKHFKATTMGHRVVMGRKTFEGIPNGLPGREVLCVSRSKQNNVETILDFEAFLKEHATTPESIFIAGGADIYAQALPYASKILLSIIHDNHVMGDTFFPKYDEANFPIKNIKSFETFTLEERERSYGYHFNY